MDDVTAVAYGMGSFLFFRFRMDTPNFIDFFHLEAERNRRGKMAACKGYAGRSAGSIPKKKLLLTRTSPVSSVDLDAQIKAFSLSFSTSVCCAM